jgi:hypothetical protein
LDAEFSILVNQKPKYHHGGTETRKKGHRPQRTGYSRSKKQQQNQIPTPRPLRQHGGQEQQRKGSAIANSLDEISTAAEQIPHPYSRAEENARELHGVSE